MRYMQEPASVKRRQWVGGVSRLSVPSGRGAHFNGHGLKLTSKTVRVEFRKIMIIILGF